MKASENDILKKIEEEFSFPGNDDLILGPGDDCAVLKPIKGQLVITTDEQVEGTHFFHGSEPEDIACKLMRSNISDLASMGNVRPISCLAGAALAPETQPDFIDRFIQQLKKEARHFGITIAGGNLAAARENHFYMTVWGEAQSAPILRDGTREGDILVNIGPLGEAKAALEAMQEMKNSGSNPINLRNLPDKFQDEYSGIDSSAAKKAIEQTVYLQLLESFWRPEPQLKAGRIIAEECLAAAMLDNSDGLLKSSKILAERAGLKAVIDASQIKISDCLGKWCMAHGKNAKAYAIAGGEDYGLIFSMRKEKLPILKQKLPGAYQIGHFEKGSGADIENFDGKIEGFEHF